MKVFNTACPRNCYSTCSFKVFVENNKVIKVEPQPLNEATPFGTCLKGLSYVERANSKKRIIYPLIKVNGKFKQIPFNNALELIAERLQFYKDKFGEHSIFFYSASGASGLLNSISTKFWELFGGTTTVYGNMCWPAGLEATRLTLGEVKHNIATDIANAKLIVLWGKNPAETNIHQMVHIERAVEKGAKLIVIDPRRTPTADVADLLIQPVQGTDGLLALCIAKIIIENNQCDNKFIVDNVLGFDEFVYSLKNISVEKTSVECGIPVSLINELADIIAKTKPMTLVPGYGMQRYSNGGQTTRCLLALSIITGNIGKKGACWHYADLQGDIFSSKKEPESYYPETSKPSVFRRSISTALLGEGMLNANNPELKFGWVERGNPITQNPESKKVIKAFKKLDFLVVVDQFMTDTALAADIILPAKSMFEQSDIISSYWNQYIQLKQKVIEPPGEVKPESEIYRLLAIKLGFNKKDIDNFFPDSNDNSINLFIDNQLSKFGLSLKKLKKKPILAPNLQKIPFEDNKFNTESGKIELLSKNANSLWGVNALPTFEILKENSDLPNENYPFFLMSPNTKNRIHSQFGNLDIIKELDPEPFATINLRDATVKGIKEKDFIRIYNDRGEIVVKVKIDGSLRPGSVVVYNGYWHQEGACPNTLSKGRETDMGHGTAFHDNKVNFEKVWQ